jgi:immune inhibitor A
MLKLKINVLFLCFMAAVMVPISAYAVPASPDIYSLQQPDGTTFNAMQWGDENLHGWETEDGYTIVFEEKMNRWTYATHDFMGNLVGTSSIAGKDTPPASLKKRMRPLVPQGIRKMINKKPVPLVPAPSLSEPEAVSGPQGAGPLIPVVVNNVPFLLANFSDRTTTFTNAQFSSMLFGIGIYSMSDYYNEVSYGSFNISSGPSGIGGWYQAPNTHDYYGSADPLNAQFVKDIVATADAAGFDFAEYDMDNDCTVDALAVVHQGPGQEATGKPTDIWSHSWSFSGAGIGAYTTNSTCKTNAAKNVVVDSYIIMPEKYGSSMTTVGVFAHEYGHALGLPDLYDTDYSSEGLGNWSLMAGGSWNKKSKPGDRPAHLDAWCKYALGWVSPALITSGVVKTSIPAVETSSTVYQLLSGSPSSGTGEYFLVENRQKIGFDAGIPGPGLLIYHVDEAQSSNRGECFPTPGRECSASRHYHVALVQADYKYSLELGLPPYGGGGNRGDAGDPFPGKAKKTQFSRASDDYNNSSLYNGWPSSPSNVTIADISNSGLVMYASMIAQPVPVIALDEALDNSAYPWSLGGDANWFGQDFIAREGNGTAQSGTIGDTQSSWFQTTVNGPFTLAFWQKVSSEKSYDYLRFSVDGTEKGKISGEVPWQQKSYSVTTTGPHTLKWSYTKDLYTSKGLDAGFVNHISISPYSKVKLLTPNGGGIVTASTGTTITWQAPALADKFMLTYTYDGRTWMAVTPDYVEGSSYPWSVPDPGVTKTGCKVKVTGYTNAGKAVGNDMSDKTFTIQP